MRLSVVALICASSAFAEEGVFAVQPKSPTFARKFEVLAYPAQIQVNGAFTHHAGGGVGVVWHPRETIGVQLSAYFNPIARESAFNGELIRKVRVEAPSSKSLLNDWGALMTAEVTPFQGKFTIDNEKLVHFSVLLFGGGGVAGTRHQLKPENEAGPATFGDTGLRPMGALGAGVRLQLGKRFSLRLEVRDLVYSGRVDRVNNCDAEDLSALNANTYTGVGRPRPVKATCDPTSFAATDIPLANNLAKSPTNELVQNIGAQLGVGFLF